MDAVNCVRIGGSGGACSSWEIYDSLTACAWPLHEVMNVGNVRQIFRKAVEEHFQGNDSLHSENVCVLVGDWRRGS